MFWLAAALIWGFAEATLFFVVPDVLLTLAAAKLGMRRALGLALVAVAGALIGGAIMHRWAGADVEAARRILDLLPSISPDMLARAAEESRGDWALEMMIGAVTGVPYKVYAVETGAAGISLPLFLIASFGTRMTRWVIVIALSAAIAELLRLWARRHLVVPVWAFFWIAFYGFYFSVMPG